MIAVKVTALRQYPIKGATPENINYATLHSKGFSSDRRWMIVDSMGNFQSQRQHPILSQIELRSCQHDGAYDVIFKPTGDRLYLEPPLIAKRQQANKMEVLVHGTKCSGIDCGEVAAAWVSRILGYDSNGESFRIVQFDEQTNRALSNPSFKDHSTHFADAYPYLLASEESLQSLNTALVESGKPIVNMQRFRPNIVISGIAGLLAGFAEQEFSYLRSLSGEVEFQLATPCKRCVVTTVDQSTGTIPDKAEPLKTLAQINPMPENGAFFGMNLVLTKGDAGRIKLEETFVLTQD